jgi:hypothetical protein
MIAHTLDCTRVLTLDHTNTQTLKHTNTHTPLEHKTARIGTMFARGKDKRENHIEADKKKAKEAVAAGT